MARADNTYSRVVTGAKTLLPLAALGLLSTLFVISNTVDPTAPVPTAPENLAERARDLGATSPNFAGVTETGDEIVFRAETAHPVLQHPDRLVADRVSSGIRLSGGTALSIRADAADFDRGTRTAGLRGAVLILTTTGYQIETDRLNAHFDELLATTPGPVTATGPLGDITAGHMRLHEAGPGQGAELLFGGGVKLIYHPKTPEDQDR